MPKTPVIPVVDMTDDPHARRRCDMFNRHWWPHPVHASITEFRQEHSVIYACSCGAKMKLKTADAKQLGLL